MTAYAVNGNTTSGEKVRAFFENEVAGTAANGQRPAVTQAADASSADANHSREPRLVGNGQKRADQQHAAEIDHSGREVDPDVGRILAPPLSSKSDHNEQQAEQIRGCRRSDDVKVGPVRKPQLSHRHRRQL